MATEPLVLLANADIVFSAGAVTALLSAIREPATGAAAPLAVWDSEGRLRLPPGRRCSMPAETIPPPQLPTAGC